MTRYTRIDLTGANGTIGRVLLAYVVSGNVRLHAYALNRRSIPLTQRAPPPSAVQVGSPSPALSS